MKLTAKQQRFVEYAEKRTREKGNTIADFEDVVLNLFHMYFTIEKESEREQVAYLIYSIREDLKGNIKIWDFLDKKKFLKDVENRMRKMNQLSKNMQKRRHEKRDDFALSEEEWEETLSYFNYECAYCGVDGKLTYDHFVPFTKSGSFTKDNIIPACKRCNSSKSNTDFIEWYEKQDFYNNFRVKQINNFVENESLKKEGDSNG